LNDSKKDNLNLKTKFEKLQSIVNGKRKEIEQLKNQVAENVNNKNEDEKIKNLYKQLVKKCRTQIEEIKNYKAASEESTAEVDQLNITIANLKYDLTQTQEGENDNDTIKALNNKIKHQKSEIEGMNNSLSDERIKNEKLKESKTEYIMIPDKKLEDSKKKLSEEVKLLKKSNKEKEEQIVELGCKLRDRCSDLDGQASDLEDKTVRLSELEKVLSNYMAVENGETRTNVNEEIVLNYKLTQIAEYQRIMRVTKEALTVGPLVEEGSCTICFDKLAHYPTDMCNSCGHKEFCLPCSKKWQNSNPGGAHCPICRSKKPVNDREYPSLRK
jgi:chromosome segregation ATPase